MAVASPSRRQRRLLWLMAIGNQSAQEVDKAIDWRTRTRMLDLRDVLQLVNDRFDTAFGALRVRALAEHQTVIQGHQALFHVALELGDELNACGFEQLFCQLLRDIAFVSKHLAKQLSEQFRHRGAVVRIAGSQDDAEQFASVIDDEMQFEAKDPIDRSFAPRREVFKHLVLLDAAVMADLDTGRIHKTDAATLAKP
jgi:hypothetical protein